MQGRQTERDNKYINEMENIHYITSRIPTRHKIDSLKRPIA